MHKQQDETFRVLKLKHPVETTPNNEIIELKFRRLSAGDMRAASDKDETVMMLNLLARSCGLSNAEFDKIDLEDVTKAGELVADFLP